MTLFDPNKHEAAALKWIAANPDGFKMFEFYALEAASTGKRFGIGQIAERVRWETRIKKLGAFKVNNNHRSYIARELVRRHPQLKDLIEFRSVKGAA